MAALPDRMLPSVAQNWCPDALNIPTFATPNPPPPPPKKTHACHGAECKIPVRSAVSRKPGVLTAVRIAPGVAEPDVPPAVGRDKGQGLVWVVEHPARARVKDAVLQQERAPGGPACNKMDEGYPSLGDVLMMMMSQPFL